MEGSCLYELGGHTLSINMEWFDISILNGIEQPLYFISIEQMVAVMPKLIVVASLAIRILLAFKSMMTSLPRI